MKRACSLISVFGCLLGLAASVQGVEPTESFESPEKSWRFAATDCRPLQVAAHERRFEGARSGRGCEHVQVIAGQGTHIYLAHPLPAARVIRETIPSIWVRSNRHGIQLMARVVYPRSLEAGRPITSFVYGDRYETPESWRQLRVDDLQTKVQREAVALRTQKGPQLDEREAYIDLLVLNIYTGPGPTSLWIDDLEVTHFADAQASVVAPQEWPTSIAAPESGRAAETAREASAVSLQGKLFIADGRPLFVRAIEHQGETFAFLQSLGFNTIKLVAAPTPGQCVEAERCGVWLIAPPPIAAADREAAAGQRVLAWHAGEALTAREAADGLRRIDEFQQRESFDQRPFVAQVTSGWPQWRHRSLIQVLDHPVLHTSFQMQDFPQWLSHAMEKSRTATPTWATLPTEPDGRLVEQMAQLGNTSPLRIEPDQLRWLAFAAVGAGAKGLWFRSRSRLDAQDGSTRYRAALLRQLNRELELVEPWVAGGTKAGEQASSNSRVRSFVLQTDTARLLILLRRLSDLQFVNASAPDQPESITLYQVPVTDQTYSVSAAGVQLVPSQRGGGLRLTLNADEAVSLVLLTADPQAVNYVGRTAGVIREELAVARQEAVSVLCQETVEVEQALEARGLPDPRSTARLAEARAHLRRAEELQGSRDFASALRATAMAGKTLAQVRRGRWEQVVQIFTSPVASPVCVTYATLPAHFELRQRLSTASWSVDLLAGGEMEHLEHLLQTGWKQHRSSLPAISGDVRLSLDDAHGGRSSLYLRAWKSDAHVTFDGEPPVSISSSPIQASAGQLLRVRGWAKVPDRLSESWDGLMIFDSQTGPALAERISETQGWREFTLYRTAVVSGPWQLHFVLSGCGEAWIDDVSVCAMTQGHEPHGASRGFP